jgi:hypothetical protein
MTAWPGTTPTPSLYREEVRDLARWYQNNNLSLNVTKTKEMIVDYRKGGQSMPPFSLTGL